MTGEWENVLYRSKGAVDSKKLDVRPPASLSRAYSSSNTSPEMRTQRSALPASMT